MALFQIPQNFGKGELIPSGKDEYSPMLNLFYIFLVAFVKNLERANLSAYNCFSEQKFARKTGIISGEDGYG
jgi:hypothetical protein